uniref:Putative F-box and FNIP repeat-containing protein n=1 Tax=Moumouvirus sp. 'Monve' TaxID=1128131 RepID=H2ECU7_9VIRU|nr:putative F-box and FNIP repeat-containing protein [Moumouvirus Monve]
MTLSIINDDIIMYIMNYLSDRDKIIFSSVNRFMRFFLDKLYYTEPHHYDVIKKLHYLERFKRIIYRFDNKSIPSIITDLIIKCSNIKNLVIPQHIIQITVCRCLYNKIDCNQIKIILDNKICKCKCFPRNDNNKFYGGAFYRISNNSPGDKFISVDDKDKSKIKYYDNNHQKYLKNIPKNNKSIKKNNYRY